MGETNYPLVITVGISLITLVLWSLLKKKNALAVGEPPMLPGALPLLGHIVSLVRDANALHMYARQWTRDLAPVSISLVGQRVYFVLNPRDVQAVWKSKTLSFDTLVEGGLVSTFGMTAKGVEKLQSDPDGEGPMLVHNHTFFKEALAPGRNLEDLTLGFIHYLDLELDQQVTQKIRASSDGYIDVKLQDWARRVLTVASTNALVGEQTLKQEPEIIGRLWEWERDFQLLSFGLPKWLMRRAHKNREDMIKGFERHVFDKDAKPFVGHKEMLMRRRGMSNFDVGAGNFSLWYALQANSPLTAFWILHYICFIPGLLDRVRTEINPAFDATGRITNLPHLLNHCPLLNSIYHEVLRYTSAAVGIRQVEEDSIIGGYTFIEGAIVMMPVRPNHFDPNVFGNDVDCFVPDRFMRTEEELSRTPGLKNPGTKVLKAFGGGTTLCPGRHFAANEILSSVAATLERFELDVVEGEKMAIPSSKEPTVGTYLADHDVKIRMRVRERR